MEHSTLMECGRYFVLCENCHNITVFEFVKCHKCSKCSKYIDNKKYKQASYMDKYYILMKALVTFKIDVLEDCHSMLSIFIEEEDKYIDSELYQIWKENDKYTYVHFERDTHNILEKYEIDPLSFLPNLRVHQKYHVNLIYGPNVIYIHQ